MLNKTLSIMLSLAHKALPVVPAVGVCAGTVALVKHAEKAEAKRWATLTPEQKIEEVKKPILMPKWSGSPLRLQHWRLAEVESQNPGLNLRPKR